MLRALDELTSGEPLGLHQRATRTACPDLIAEATQNSWQDNATPPFYAITQLCRGLTMVPTIDQLATLFSYAIAPAFFLGAVAGFISLMSDRLGGVMTRARLLNSIPTDSEKAHLKMDIGRLRRRASLLRNGILLSLCSGICSALLLGIIFASGFFGLHHAYGAGLLFILANVLLGGALVRFAQDAAMDLNELDYVE